MHNIFVTLESTLTLSSTRNEASVVCLLFAVWSLTIWCLFVFLLRSLFAVTSAFCSCRNELWPSCVSLAHIFCSITNVFSAPQWWVMLKSQRTSQKRSGWTNWTTFTFRGRTWTGSLWTTWLQVRQLHVAALNRHNCYVNKGAKTFGQHWWSAIIFIKI